MLSNHWINFNAVYPWQVGYVACDEPSYDPWSLQVKPMNTPYIYMHHRRDENAGISTYQKGDIIMLVVFALSTIVHFLQVVRYRQWWLLLLPVGTLAEVGGYIPYVYLFIFVKLTSKAT